MSHTDTKTDIVTSRLNWHKARFGEEKITTVFVNLHEAIQSTHIFYGPMFFVFAVPIRIDSFTTVVTIFFLSI